MAIGIWRKHETALGLPCTKAIHLQTINRLIFNELLVQHFSVVGDTPEPKSTSSAWASMTVDEEEAVRYAAGYVSMKLKKHFMKKSTSKAANFVECLTHMAVDGEEASFLQYTQTWTKLVGRGGLFEVSDTTFLFFKSIEVQIQRLLPEHLWNPTSSKEQLVGSIVNEENVNILWSVLATDLKDEGECASLLEAIVDMWLTMRGFAMAGSWQSSN